jgi:hypothetical protein
MMAKNGKKICSKCKVEKDISEYSKHSKQPDGLRISCKQCIAEYKKDYRQRAKHSIINLPKKYDETYYERNKQIIKAKAKAYYEANKQKLLANNKQWRQANKEKITSYRIENRDKFRFARKKYYENNKLHCNISSSIKEALDISTRSKAIFEKLGYTIDDLKTHLESKFSEGMSWDNYGEWHIDHIIPQSWLPFDSLESENFKKCWALSNLQPLWAKDNCSKGNRFAG